jgi:SAM-dependent methyltransferase
VRDEVAWCGLDNDGYTADLDLWLGLCSPTRISDSPAPTYGAKAVLELGAGVGRVSIRLGKLGADVWAIDTERELLDEVERRARAAGVEGISPICADARSYSSGGRRFDLVIAPQVLVQTFEAPADRRAIMACASSHLARRGSSFWMTFHPDLEPAWADEADAPFPVQATELDGRTFEQEPLESYWRQDGGERSLRIVWLRRVDGTESTVERCYAELTQSGLEAEARAVGLELVDSITLPGGDYLDQVALQFVVAGR